MKLDLLTNATVADDAIRFVSQKGQGGANTEPQTDNFIIEERGPYIHHQNQEQESDRNSASLPTNQVF